VELTRRRRFKNRSEKIETRRAAAANGPQLNVLMRAVATLKVEARGKTTPDAPWKMC